MNKYKDTITTYNNWPIDGVQYLDLNPIYSDPVIRAQLVNDCLKILMNTDISMKHMWHSEFDAIGVVESRGYIIGSMLAHELNKGLVMLRSKPNRLPGKTTRIGHTLEYGTAQMEVQNGTGKILILDDVLATGGTAKAATNVLRKAGYDPISALFLVELEWFDPGLEIPHASAIKYKEKV